MVIMVRILLDEGTSRDQVDDLALAVGLALVNVVPRTEAHPAQLVYATPDRRAQVHLVDAGDGGLSWVVRAEGDGAVEERWAGALRAAMAGGA
jgi:hypothetical protein